MGPPLLCTDAYWWGPKGMGPIPAPNQVMYSDGSSNRHPNHLINGQQILTIQNEYIVDTIVRFIRKGVKLEISDYYGGSLMYG